MQRVEYVGYSWNFLGNLGAESKRKRKFRVSVVVVEDSGESLGDAAWRHLS
jgi:hypothetical protein